MRRLNLKPRLTFLLISTLLPLTYAAGAPLAAVEPDSIPSSGASQPDSIADEKIVYETNGSAESDSLALPTYNLDEIVVKADREVRLKDGMAYFPSESARKYSADGISLLSRMMIPTLRVNLASNTVESVTKKEIKYFINGLVANNDEIMAIAPEDVNKVEVLEYPKDAKYLGAEIAINYVVTKYLWGGYTKIHVVGAAPVYSGNGNVQSGFTYKRMTYNVFLSSSYNEMDGSSHQTERLLIDGHCYTTDSESELKHGHSATQRGYFSALYATDKVKFKNTISLNYGLTPDTHRTGWMNYAREEEQLLATSTDSKSKSKNLSPSWNTYLLVLFSGDASLTVNASTLFRSNRSGNNYKQWQGDELMFDNTYTARETGSSSSMSVNFSKMWNKKHQFSVWTFGSYKFYRLAYQGSVNSTNKVADWYGLVGVDYTYMWDRGRLSFCAKGNYVESGFNKEYEPVRRILPAGYINFNLNPGHNQQLSALVAYNVGTFPLNAIDPTLIQNNLLVWSKGNPKIKPVSSINTQIYYKWWNEHVSLVPVLTSDVSFNNIYRNATVNENGDGITLSYEPGVTWVDIDLGLNVSWYLNQSFSFYVSPTLSNLYKTSSSMTENKWRFSAMIQGQWQHKWLSLYAAFSTPTHAHGFNGYFRNPMYYYIGANFILKNWHLGVTVRNPFKSKKGEQKWGHSSDRLYSFEAADRSIANSTMVSIGAVYTIRYGKKQTNENQESIQTDQSLLR